MRAEGQQHADAVAHAGIGGGGEGGRGTDTHAEHRPRARPRLERRHHGRRVLGTQAAARETRQRRHHHLEARAREQPRGARQTRVVLARGGQAMHEQQRRREAGDGAAPAIDGRGERLAHRDRRERVQRGQRAVGQELGEERGREDERGGVAGDRRGEDEGEGEGGEAAGYFRLTHFTRRHPLNMFTWCTSSGVSPTSTSSGLSARLDFQPSRVQTGATRSSSQPVTRRSLRKWFRITRVPPGFTTRRISRSTATGSGTAEIVYVATALSNSLSPKSMEVASMTLSVTFGIARLCTRSTALSSISPERSMPVRRHVAG